MKRMGIAAAVAAAATALLATVPADAGTAPAVTVSPTSGPVGTTVMLSGDGCPNGTVIYGILRPYDSESGSSWPIVVDHIEVGEDGEWSGEVVVPAVAPVPDGDGGWVETEVVPGAGYTAGGICGSHDPEAPGFEYEHVPFEVTEGSVPTTTVPGSTTTTTRPVWEPPTTAPPPATPITDDPPFTG